MVWSCTSLNNYIVKLCFLQDSHGGDEVSTNGDGSKLAECVRLDYGRTESEEEAEVSSDENARRIKVLEQELKELKRQNILGCKYIILSQLSMKLETIDNLLFFC